VQVSTATETQREQSRAGHIREKRQDFAVDVEQENFGEDSSDKIL